MQSLFDKFKPRGSSFLPRTLSDLFALRLAQKLGDTAAVHHYVQLADRYSEGQLICAYKRARRSEAMADMSRRFHVELDRLPRNGNHIGYNKLVSIRIERRAVCARFPTSQSALACAAGCRTYFLIPTPCLQQYPLNLRIETDDLMSASIVVRKSLLPTCRVCPYVQRSVAAAGERCPAAELIQVENKHK
jgi:hypothetical protein